MYNTRRMGFYLPVMNRLPVLATLALLMATGCAHNTAGLATPSAPIPPTTAESLPALLLSAGEVGRALGRGEVIVTHEVSQPWSDTGHFAGTGCLAVAGAAQRGVYADTGFTALRGQVLREPPTAGTWSHFAVQTVVLFPTPQAASDFFARSRDGWAGCANRELTYTQEPAPEQVWSVGPARSARGGRDLLTVSRVQRSPERWSCQRALSVRGPVAVDVEACSLDGPTSAAATIATAIGDRLPAA